MYKGKRVFAVVPAYNERDHIAGVVRTVPDCVDGIVVVDDASDDGTAAVAQQAGDSRTEVIRHETNQGVGGAIITGHRRGFALGADICAVMAGDAQMDPSYLQCLLDAIIEDGHDFAKGNRFQSRVTLRGMPRHRVWGNAMLTLLTKFSSGYWQIFDPQNGYSAITREAFETLNSDRLKRNYLFENSVLCELGLHDFRVRDVPIPSVYGDEKSKVRVAKFSLQALVYLQRAFWRRIFLKYIVRDFHPIALFYLSGTILTLLGIGTGIAFTLWSIGPTQVSPGTVMLSVIPFLVGLQFLLTAITLDVWATRR